MDGEREMKVFEFARMEQMGKIPNLHFRPHDSFNYPRYKTFVPFPFFFMIRSIRR